jgi:hypothetical protein
MIELMDNILEHAVNDGGFLIERYNPKTGEVLKTAQVVQWGYVLNAHYTVYQIDGTETYRKAVLDMLQKTLGEGHRRRDHTDAIESAIILFNEEPAPVVAAYLEECSPKLFSSQTPDKGGFIMGGGRYAEGNIPRTGFMFSLWKSQGVTAHPWNSSLTLGAHTDGSRRLWP